VETKHKLILWAVLFLVGFLLGFFPQYSRRAEVQDRLEQTREELRSARGEIDDLVFQLRLAEMRDLLGMLHLEATRQNFGVAADHSTRFFNLVGELAALDPDDTRRAELQRLLQGRDTVTALLAQGDPAVVAEIRSLLIRAHEATRE
jgi:hypothetical protein